MCYPVLIAAAAAAAASAYSQKQVSDAQGKYADEERKRQKSLSGESDAIFQKNLKEAGTGQTEIELNGLQGIQDRLNSQLPDIYGQDSGASGGAATPKVIADSFRSAMADSEQRTRAQSRARADQIAFNNMLSKSGLNYRRAAENQGLIQDFMRSSNDVFQNSELPAGAQAGQGMSTLGSVLGSFSNAYGKSKIGDAYSAGMKE